MFPAATIEAFAREQHVRDVHKVAAAMQPAVVDALLGALPPGARDAANADPVFHAFAREVALVEAVEIINRYFHEVPHGT